MICSSVIFCLDCLAQENRVDNSIILLFFGQRNELDENRTWC